MVHRHQYRVSRSRVSRWRNSFLRIFKLKIKIKKKKKKNLINMYHIHSQAANTINIIFSFCSLKLQIANRKKMKNHRIMISLRALPISELPQYTRLSIEDSVSAQSVNQVTSLEEVLVCQAEKKKKNSPRYICTV